MRQLFSLIYRLGFTELFFLLSITLLGRSSDNFFFYYKVINAIHNYRIMYFIYFNI